MVKSSFCMQNLNQLIGTYLYSLNDDMILKTKKHTKLIGIVK